MTNFNFLFRNLRRGESHLSTSCLLLASYLPPTRLLQLRYAAMVLFILTLGAGNAWGQVSSAAPADGGEYVVTVYSDSKYYALPNTTTDGGTLTGVEVTVNSSGKVTSDNPPTWTLTKGSTSGQFYLSYTSGVNTYYLYKNGTGKSNYNFKVSTGSKNYWSFTTSSTGYTVTAVDRGSNHLNIQLNSTTFRCNATASVVRLLEVAAAGPSLTATPTSLNFGTVAQNASIAAKTFSVSGSNLTGAITIAAPSGYTVSPTSITPVSKSISATDVTVTPNTATAGTFNGNVTISGGGLASNVTVGLTMTVQASHTVTWMVNGSEHATTQVVSGGHPVFPSVPSSCDAGKVFVGWTETNIGSSETDTPPTFITTATTISSDKTYYAVFAKKGDFVRVTGPSSLANGQLLVIVSNKYSTAITNGIGYTTAPTESSSKVTATDAMTWLLTGNSTSGWAISKIANGYLLGYASNPSSNSSTAATLASNNSCSTWGIGQNSYTSNVLYISNKSTATCALEASSSSANWVVYNSSSYNTNQYCALKVYASTLTKFVTSCCTPLGTINGSIKSISGTSATLKWDDLSNVDATTPYSVTVSPSAGTSVGGISTVDGYKNCTVSGLTAGTEYTFTINAYGDATHCNSSQNVVATTPKITLGSASGTSTYIEGNGPGSKQTFTVTAVGLTGNLTVTAPTNFAVCATESGTYTSSITLTPTSGAVSTTVYFQLVAEKTAAASPYAGNVTVSGGSATEQTVAVNGTVNQACADPTITVQPAASTSYNLNVSATALSVTATKNGTGPALTYQWYSNTANSKTTPTPSPIDGATSSSYTPPTTATGTKYYFCEVSSGACAVTSNISAITVNTPSITVSETSIAFGDKAKDGSHTATFTVSGTNLASSTGLTLAVTGSSYFTIDKTSVAQTSAGAVSSTTITVTYAPTAIGDGHSATITVSSTGATNKTVTLSGNSKYQITWVNEAASPAATTYTYVASGKPTFPSNPTGGCDTYTYFYGWAEGTFTTPVTAPGTSSTIKVYKSASEMPNVSGNVTYYAVWSNAAPADYSTTYTSNVTLPTSGTNVYSANVTISGNNYSGAKIGKSGGAGSSSFTVPSGTKKIFLHTVNWYNEDNTLTLSSGTLGVTISPNDAITPPRNSGMEGSDNDFTLATLDGTQYKEYTLTGVSSTATINVSSTSRLLVWGINATSSTGEGNCVTSCCEEVAARSGSVSTESTSATVSWTVSGTAASKISSWDVSCNITGGASAGTKGSITTDGSTKSITFTGLTAITGYTFHILGTSNDAAYCEVNDELMGTTECLTPSSLSISSTGNKWDFCAGESMTLTVNGTNISGSATYQWQKHNGSTWVDIDGATNVSYSTTMASDKAGQYRCTVTNPGSGSCDATTDGVWVRVWQLYINNGTADAYQYLDFSNTGTGTGSNTTVFLYSDKAYQFKLADNNGGWFGLNSKTVTTTISAFALNGTGANVNLTSGLEGNYTFTINYSDKNNPTIAVTYPVGNQPSGRKIWFDKSIITGWTDAGTSDLVWRIGKSNNSMTNQDETANYFSLVPGTDRFYVYETKEYNGFEAWHVANNTSWSGTSDGSGQRGIYYHYHNQASTDVTRATVYQKYVIGTDGVTLVPTTKQNTDYYCDFWNVSKTDGMLTHTATITPPTNGTITIANAAQSLEATTTTSDLPHRTILTVTATPAPGYQLSSLTVNGVAFTSGNEHILSADATIAATFTAKTITITWNENGGNTPSPTESSYTYNGSTVSLATVTHATKLFAGWFTDPSAGTQITEIGTTNKPTADVTYYAHWVDGNTVIFHPGVGSVTPASVTQTSIGGAVDIPTPIIDCDGWSFAGWNIGSALAETTTNPEASLQAAGSAAYVPATATVHMYAVWKKNFGGGTGDVTATYDWDANTTGWSVPVAVSTQNSGGNPNKCGQFGTSSDLYIQFSTKVAVTAFSCDINRTSTNDNGTVKIEYSSNGSTWTEKTSRGIGTFPNGNWAGDGTSFSTTFDGENDYYVRFHYKSTGNATRKIDNMSITYTGTIPDSYKWTSTAEDYGCVSANQVKTPVISPDTEDQTGDVSVTITCATDGATIRYTTDGTDPSSSTGTVYSGAFTVSCSATVKAIAYKATMDDSEIAEQEYTVTVPTPTFSLPAGTYYDANQSVTLSLPTAHTGTVIKYTTNGDDPTSSSATYSSAITVTEGTTTIKAIGYNATCGTSSSVASATYIVRFGTDYTLVTDANDLMAGDQVVIISADAGTSSKYAISTTISSNKRTSTGDYNINAGLTTATIYPAVGAAATVQVFTLGGEPGAWTFHETTNNGYLNCPSAGKLTNTATVSNSNKWTIAIASNIATIRNNEVDATIKSNTGAGHVFAAYAPATENVQLVKLYSIPNPDPVIKIDADLSAFSACRGSASDYQSFYISGKNLDGSIVLSNVAPLAGYEFCLTSGGTYTATLELTPVSKTVAKTQVFVRLAAGATAGTKNGNLNAAVSANSLSTNIAVTGSVSTADTYTDQIHNTVVTNQCGEYLAPSCPDASAPADESCVETHFKFMGWITEADKNASGVKDDAWYIAHLVTAGTAMTADGTNYYAVWAKEED